MGASNQSTDRRDGRPASARFFRRTALIGFKDRFDASNVPAWLLRVAAPSFFWGQKFFSHVQIAEAVFLRGGMPGTGGPHYRAGKIQMFKATGF